MSDNAKAYALRLLGQRPYTIRDLQRKLERKEFPSEEVEPAIHRLTELGLLDDGRFALNFARGKLTAGGSSPRRVRQSLLRKGIAAPVADAAISDVIESEEIDVAASLEQLATKRLSSFSGLDPKVVYRRLFGFLVRRGYDLDEIRRVLSKLLR